MAKTSILQPDDFLVGMFVTVFEVKETLLGIEENEDANLLQKIMMQQGGRSQYQNNLEMLKGLVLRIDAINLPFIIVSVFDATLNIDLSPKYYSAPLDVRDLNFIKLNEEYVKAYLGKNSLKSLLQNNKFSDMQNIEGFETLSELLKQVAENFKNQEKNDED